MHTYSRRASSYAPDTQRGTTRLVGVLRYRRHRDVGRRHFRRTGKARCPCRTKPLPALEAGTFSPNAEGVEPSSPGLTLRGYPGDLCERVAATPTRLWRFSSTRIAFHRHGATIGSQPRWGW